MTGSGPANTAPMEPPPQSVHRPVPRFCQTWAVRYFWPYRGFADMAIRLEKEFGSTADTWLRMQMHRDLWEARQRADTIKVNKRVATAALC
jgi:hypothetical protein